MVFQPFDPAPPPRRRRFKAIPVRTLLPNLITLLALCAGLTSIRLAIEAKLEWALAAIVFAALLDGIDGRVARMLKGTSRFGAELDSLADFVNFGVAPALLIFTWGLGDLKSAGWICVLIFALASALRLARFNAAIEEERPKWQSNYFIGMPTPAAAIAVLLPVYISQLGFDEIRARWALMVVLVYTLFIAFMMVSTIPTYSGKLLGERVGREWVLPIFMIGVGLVAMLFTYPYQTLTAITLVYLACIPLSWRHFRDKVEASAVAGDDAGGADGPPEQGQPESGAETEQPTDPLSPGPTGRIFTLRPSEPPK
jgi:CDP-diacylglycerol--serine O-phosphatidyltransferase